MYLVWQCDAKMAFICSDHFWWFGIRTVLFICLYKSLNFKRLLLIAWVQLRNCLLLLDILAFHSVHGPMGWPRQRALHRNIQFNCSLFHCAVFTLHSRPKFRDFLSGLQVFGAVATCLFVLFAVYLPIFLFAIRLRKQFSVVLPIGNVFERMEIKCRRNDERGAIFFYWYESQFAF